MKKLVQPHDYAIWADDVLDLLGPRGIVHQLERIKIPTYIIRRYWGGGTRLRSLKRAPLHRGLCNALKADEPIRKLFWTIWRNENGPFFENLLESAAYRWPCEHPSKLSAEAWRWARSRAQLTHLDLELASVELATLQLTNEQTEGIEPPDEFVGIEETTQVDTLVLELVGLPKPEEKASEIVLRDGLQAAARYMEGREGEENIRTAAVLHFLDGDRAGLGRCLQRFGTTDVWAARKTAFEALVALQDSDYGKCLSRVAHADLPWPSWALLAGRAYVGLEKYSDAAVAFLYLGVGGRVRSNLPAKLAVAALQRGGYDVPPLLAAAAEKPFCGPRARYSAWDEVCEAFPPLTEIQIPGRKPVGFDSPTSVEKSKQAPRPPTPPPRPRAPQPESQMPALVRPWAHELERYRQGWAVWPRGMDILNLAQRCLHHRSRLDQALADGFLDETGAILTELKADAVSLRTASLAAAAQLSNESSMASAALIDDEKVTPQTIVSSLERLSELRQRHLEVVEQSRRTRLAALKRGCAEAGVQAPDDLEDLDSPGLQKLELEVEFFKFRSSLLAAAVDASLAQRKRDYSGELRDRLLAELRQNKQPSSVERALTLWLALDDGVCNEYLESALEDVVSAPGPQELERRLLETALRRLASSRKCSFGGVLVEYLGSKIQLLRQILDRTDAEQSLLEPKELAEAFERLVSVPADTANSELWRVFERMLLRSCRDSRDAVRLCARFLLARPQDDTTLGSGLKRLVEYLSREGRSGEAVTLAFAGYKRIHSGEMLRSIVPDLVTAAEQLARRSDEVARELKRILFQSPDWLFALEDGALAFLVLQDLDTDREEATLRVQAHRYRYLQPVAEKYPVLVAEYFLSSRFLDVVIGTESASSVNELAILHEFEHELGKHSCYGGWDLAPRFQRKFRSFLERSLKELASGAAGAHRVLRDLKDFEADTLINGAAREVGTDVQGKALPKMRDYLDGQVARLNALGRLQIDLDSANFREALLARHVPIARRLREEALALKQSSALAASTYDYVLGGAVALRLNIPQSRDTRHLETLAAGVPVEKMIAAFNPDPLICSVDALPEDAEHAHAGQWLKAYLPYVAETATLESVLAAAIARGDLVRVAEAFDRLSPRNTAAQVRAKDAFRDATAALGRKARELNDLISQASNRRGLPRDDRDWLELAKEYLRESSPSDVIEPSTELASEIISRRNDLENYYAAVTGIVAAAGLREAEERIEILNVANAIFQQIRTALIDPASDARANVQEVFRALPDLALEARTNVLHTVLRHAEGKDWQQAREIATAEALPAPNFRPALLASSGPQPSATSPLKLSKTGQYVMKAARGTQGQTALEPAEIARRAIAKRNVILDPQRAGAHLIGAAGLVGDRDEPVRLALLGEGFICYGTASVLNRRYPPAIDLFLDALGCLRQAASVGPAPNNLLQRAFTGALLASWAPAIGENDGHLLDDVDAALQNPSDILQRLRHREQSQVVWSCWDKLDGAADEAIFLQTLMDVDPDPRWLAQLLRNSMLPTYMFRGWERAIRQATAILHASGAPTASLEPLRERMTSAFETISQGRLTSRTLDRAREALIGETRALQLVPSEIREAWIEAADRILESLREGVPKANGIRFIVSSATKNIYADENSGRIDVHFTVSSQVDSEALTGLSLSIRLPIENERQYNSAERWIRVPKPPLLVGNLDPGESKDVALRLQLDRGILEHLREFWLNAQVLMNGDPVAPSDRKAWIHFDVLTRPVVGANPYVTGDALLPSSDVYVGRETELAKVKAALQGRAQDNLPMVVGIRRIGKTSLLKKLLDDAEIKRSYIPVFCDLQTVPATETTENWFIKLAERIRLAASDYGFGLDLSRAEIREEPDLGFETFVKQIDRRISGKRVLVIFDEFEALLETIEAARRRGEKENRALGHKEALVNVMPMLRSSLHHVTNLSFIISGTPAIRSAFSGESARFFGNVVLVAIEPLKNDDLRRLVDASKSLFEVRGDGLDLLRHMTGMQPYLLQNVLHHLYAYMKGSGRDVATRLDIIEVIRKQILPMASLFVEYLQIAERLKGDHVLRVMAHAHHRAWRTENYISIDKIRVGLASRSIELTTEEIEDRLLRLAEPEFGLVVRSPSSSTRWKLVIGLLGEFIVRSES